jgi:hypothetical protein
MRKKNNDFIANESMAMIMYLIFEQVYPVWRQYRGHVPENQLEQLDLEGDFPTGLAAIAVRRLNRDRRLQKLCEQKFSKGFAIHDKDV